MQTADDGDASPAKRSRFVDPIVTLTAAELRPASNKDLVAHIIALQKDKKKPAKAATAPAPLTPEQVTAKVDSTRNMMISGIKGQIQVIPHPHPFHLTRRERELSCVVETIL